MKNILKAAALGIAPVAIIGMGAVPVSAQTKQAIGVVSVDRAVATSNAYRTAMDQMKVTYKANIDSFNARKGALDTELKQKSDALRTAVQAAAGKPSPALQTQYEALQKRNQEAQQELQTIGAPIARAQAYVEEQIGAKVGDALKAAMTKKGVDLVISPDATVSYQPAVEITDAVVTELNTLVPSVSITPPADWQPGGQGQQAAAPAAPAKGQQPQSR